MGGRRGVAAHLPPAPPHRGRRAAGASRQGKSRSKSQPTPPHPPPPLRPPQVLLLPEDRAQSLQPGWFHVSLLRLLLPGEGMESPVVAGNGSPGSPSSGVGTARSRGPGGNRRPSACAPPGTGGARGKPVPREPSPGRRGGERARTPRPAPAEPLSPAAPVALSQQVHARVSPSRAGRGASGHRAGREGVSRCPPLP